MTDAVSGKPKVLVIGAGPAGLMAAEHLSHAGCAVTVADAKPSVGRKFLMAGKSGLNLTRDEPIEAFLHAYAEATPWLRPMIEAFDATAVQNWARDLGQEVFTGSTGRVFPTTMKASPLLRAWLRRLNAQGVELRTRWRWTGWDDDDLAQFETPEGRVMRAADATILAMGGASWSRLGSDGLWADVLGRQGLDIAPFAPANSGLRVDWSTHMQAVFGQPLKGVAFRAGPYSSRGEAVISARGLEGGGIYAISRGVREGHRLVVDLMPDTSVKDLTARLARPSGKASWSNHLRKSLKLGTARTALLNEFARPLPTEPASLVALIKAVPVSHSGLAPLDEAISTAGGAMRSALDDGLMIKANPGIFCAGEMLDWEAPTGGYLLTGCFATGRWAGRSAAAYLREIGFDVTC